MRKWAVIGALALVVLLAGAAVLLREQQLTAYKLCQIFYVRIVIADHELDSPKGSAHDYFLAHPKALKAAHRENHETLAALPCRP